MAATASITFPGRTKGSGEVAIVFDFSRCPQFVKPCTVAATWASLTSFWSSAMAAPPHPPPTLASHSLFPSRI
jgi:hypothetical protein